MTHKKGSGRDSGPTNRGEPGRSPVEPQETKPSRAAANPATCQRWDSYKHDADLHARIVVLEVDLNMVLDRIREMETKLDSLQKREERH